jgi:hypothetical protein
MSLKRHEGALGETVSQGQSVGRARRRAVILLLVLVAALCVYAPLSSIQVLPLKNGRIATTSYTMQEDPWHHPRLRRLRQREGLDGVVAPGKTQFEKIVLLRRWARRQWEAGPTPFYYPAWDALEILDLARNHRNRAFCAQYAVLFLQTCRSMGLHARYLDRGHFIASVWSDEHNRWVVMDPTNDLHYEWKGVPLGDLDIIRAARDGTAKGIEVVGPEGARKPITLEELAPFRALSVCLLNDQLTNPAVVVQNGKSRVLATEADYRRYPVVGKDEVGYGNFCLAWRERDEPSAPNRPASSDRDDFIQALNQTIIFVSDSSSPQSLVKLRLFTETAPEFQAFVGGPEGEAPADLTQKIVWNLRPGFNTFTARVKTSTGWLGPESKVKVFYKPSWITELSMLGWRMPGVSYSLASLL